MFAVQLPVTLYAEFIVARHRTLIRLTLRAKCCQDLCSSEVRPNDFSFKALTIIQLRVPFPPGEYMCICVCTSESRMGNGNRNGRSFN